MGPNLRKLKKKKTQSKTKQNKKTVKAAIFEGEKSLDMGFRPWAVHPVKNNLNTPGT